MNTKAIGEVSEAIVLARLLKRGWAVLLPWGDNQRYDFVLERGLGFETVQVKTGRLRKGMVKFWSASVREAGERYVRKGYAGHVQWFGVYCPELDKVYLVPVSERQNMSLRVEPSKNNQRDRVHWARDYEV